MSQHEPVMRLDLGVLASVLLRMCEPARAELASNSATPPFVKNDRIVLTAAEHPTT